MSNRIEEIISRCEKAPEGPWVIEGCGGVHMDGTRDWYDVVTPKYIGIYVAKSKEEAEFIAHSREDIPYLIEEIKKLKRDLKSAQDWGQQKDIFQQVAEKENIRLRKDNENLKAKNLNLRTIESAAKLWDKYTTDKHTGYEKNLHAAIALCELGKEVTTDETGLVD